MGDTDHHTTEESVRNGRDRRTLTRRDAIGALTAGGVTAVAGCSGLFDSGESSTGEDPDHETKTMRALATVLYPSEIELGEEFLDTYLYSRIVDEDAYAEELRTAVETLDGLADEQHGAAFRTLDSEQQVAVIEESEIRSGNSVPDGTNVERLNYHLVDELLFACYASPTGGELVGNTNPRGWPGGFGYVPEAPQ